MYNQICNPFSTSVVYNNQPHKLINPVLVARLINVILPSQQTQNTCITFVQRRPNVFDVGPTLYKCYTSIICLLG